TTAGALIYHQHDKICYEYLNSILQQHKNWVPTMYPTKIHSLLCLVDTLQNLGVHRHFKSEIKKVLDEIYRLWQQKNEEIFSNVTHCAMAFRLLRMSNYDVSSDELAEFVVEEHFFATSGKYTSHVEILELHKASQLAIDHEKNDILDKINNWARTFMEQKLLSNGFIDRMSKKEVELALRKFYTTYDRAEIRRYIKSYEENNFKILKAAYRWDDYASVGYNSERVKWLEVMKCMLIERLEWWTSKTMPSIEEYLYVTSIIFGSRLIPLTTQYYLGINISKDLLESDEIYGLCNCTGIVMRLLNDLQTFKREQEESSINLVTILMTQSPRRTNISEEEAIMKIKEILESNRRELLKMVLVQKKGSQLPQLCKEIFWRTSKMVYFTYSHGDEYRFPEEMKNHIDEVIYKPLNH
ncbi:hypothetical protein H5410_039723, partial [Solanum commersonii]